MTIPVVRAELLFFFIGVAFRSRSRGLILAAIVLDLNNEP